MNTKQAVHELLDRLPEDCSFADVIHHVDVLRAVEHGLSDLEAGRVSPHEVVAQALRRKWQLDD